MKLYIVRHGQTEWNQLKVMQGLVDIPLNENGKEQAIETGKLLKNRSFDIIISSPLLRAKETAEIVNSLYNKEIIIDERLSERNYGEFEGIKKADMPYNDFWNFNLDCKYEKAENVRDFYNRIVELIEEIRIKYNNKNILLSTHAGVCKILEYYFNPNSENSNNGDLGPYLPANSEIIEYEL